MTYKNIKTATAQELGRITGVQHHAWKIRNSLNPEHERSIYDKPLDFDMWFQRGLKHYTSKGYKFQWLNLGLLRVTLPNGMQGLRSTEDFFDEWETDYCPQFPSY